MSTTNPVEKKLKLREALNWQTKKKVVPSLGKSAVQIGAGVIGGSVLAALIGRPSLALGSLVVFGGNMLGSTLAPTVGLGMMAYGLGAENKGNVKERYLQLWENAKSKAYAEEIGSLFSKAGKRSSPKESATNGIGAWEEAQPTLDEIEQQLVAAAMEYQRQQGKRSTSNASNVSGYSSDDVDTSTF